MIAEKGLAILEQSRPQYYSENDVWSQIEKLGVMPELRKMRGQNENFSVLPLKCALAHHTS